MALEVKAAGCEALKRPDHRMRRFWQRSFSSFHYYSSTSPGIMEVWTAANGGTPVLKRIRALLGFSHCWESFWEIPLRYTRLELAKSECEKGRCSISDKTKEDNNNRLKWKKEGGSGVP